MYLESKGPRADPNPTHPRSSNCETFSTIYVKRAPKWENVEILRILATCQCHSLHYSMGKLKNRVKSSQLWQIISPWILTQKIPNFAHTCINSSKTQQGSFTIQNTFLILFLKLFWVSVLVFQYISYLSGWILWWTRTRKKRVGSWGDLSQLLHCEDFKGQFGTSCRSFRLTMRLLAHWGGAKMKLAYRFYLATPPAGEVMSSQQVVSSTALAILLSPGLTNCTHAPRLLLFWQLNKLDLTTST